MISAEYGCLSPDVSEINPVSKGATCAHDKVGQMDNLDRVARIVRNCTRCSLSQSHISAVPGEGNSHARVMFIGEGLGFLEDLQGVSFVGVDQCEDVFIANMVKFRPLENRDPTPPELAARTKYLDRQIDLVDLKLIVTLGQFAFGRYFPGEDIAQVRGNPREKDGRKILLSLHAVAVLRRNELRPTMIEDFKTISEIFKGESNEIGRELIGTVSKTLDTSQDNHKIFQLPLMGASTFAAKVLESAVTSAVNAKEDSFPGWLALF